MSNEVTIHNIQELFFRMEEVENLFSLQMSDGTYYWDIVRRQVFLSLHAIHGGPFANPADLPVPPLATKVRDLWRLVVNQITCHYLVTRAPQYLFITGQRIRHESHLIDNISDHLYDLLYDDAVAIELMNRGTISYRDIILGRKTRIPPVAVQSSLRGLDLSLVTEAISAVIRKHFGISIDTYSLIAEPIKTFIGNRQHYLQLFAKHRPKAIICINNGTLYGMFRAANEMRIPVIELQHGASSSRTIFWSYPTAIMHSHPGLSLPTAYLTFSDFWNRNTHYPVSRTYSIGNDYFYQKQVAGDDNGVLIISAYMYHESLLELALELAPLVKEKTIYYKLHPHQFDQAAAVTRACTGRKNIVIVSGEMEIPELFQRSNYVIGVHSTLMYVALQAGKKVCLYKRSNYFWHDDIFPYVELFDNASELRSIVESIPGRHFNNPKPSPLFFEPFGTRRFKQILDEIESLS